MHLLLNQCFVDALARRRLFGSRNGLEIVKGFPIVVRRLMIDLPLGLVISLFIFTWLQAWDNFIGEKGRLATFMLKMRAIVDSIR